MSCSLFLDTPRLRGVLREGEAIAAMLDQTPLDDWDEHDRSLVRDGVLSDAFGSRPNSRALAQIMFRLSRHPRVRYDERPDARRHPQELPSFAIDPRGVRLVANIRGATPVPGFETSDGRRLNPRDLVILEGPPAWIADEQGAYLLDATLDAARAERAITAARKAESAPMDDKPSLETLAKVAPYLALEERERFGIEDVREPKGRLSMAWRDAALVIHPQLYDEASGAKAGLSASGAIATIGGRLVRFPSEDSRALAERLTAAGCVPRFDGTFSLHGPERAAEFVRETLPQWSDLDIELDATLRKRFHAHSSGFAGGRASAERRRGLVRTGNRRASSTRAIRLPLKSCAQSSAAADATPTCADASSTSARCAIAKSCCKICSGAVRADLLRSSRFAMRSTSRSVTCACRKKSKRCASASGISPASRWSSRRKRSAACCGTIKSAASITSAIFRVFDSAASSPTRWASARRRLRSRILLRRKEIDGPAPSLVIAPTSVTHTWVNEIAKFTPQLRALKLSSGSDRASRYDEIEQYDVVITSYALARIDAEKLAQFKFRTIILDEAQNAKNPSSQISKVVRSLRAEHRLALTGTPVENSLRDLWAIFAFLEPGLLGTESSFRRRFEVPIAGGDQRAISRLHARLEPFVLRRTKEDVAPELPERTEAEIVVDLSPAQRQLYRAIAEAARREILDGWDDVPHEKASIHVLAALTRLRQVCAHPGLLAKRFLDEPESSAKFEALRETIDEIRDGGHRVLVFSAFASMLRLIKDDLFKRDVGFAYLDGSVKDRDRQAEVERFMSDDGPPVFLCSLKAGGVGLTLTAADYVILYDPWWNPAVERQAIDRTHRIGQRHPVTAYRMLTRGTVEEKIRALAARKRELSENVIRADSAIAKALTREDLEFLLSEPDDGEGK